MQDNLQTLDDTALRVVIDLRDAYDATMALWRSIDEVEGRMAWKTVSGRDYLYHLHGRMGNGRSLGPRSQETERLCETFRAKKTATKDQLAATEPDLRRAAAMYVAAGLPVVDSWSAKLFQHLDRHKLLGPVVIVVGTNALPAYQLEAQVRTAKRIHATRDTDVAWVDRRQHNEPVLWPVLREFDPTFQINAEQPFQAIGRGSRELDVLASPQLLPLLSSEPFRLAELPEQDWLLLGDPVRHVVTALDRTPTAIIAPDPRYFALQKAWLSRKPERDALKKPKDWLQAQTVWTWLSEMPRYRVDPPFLQSLPSPLAALAAELSG